MRSAPYLRAALAIAAVCAGLLPASAPAWQRARGRNIQAEPPINIPHVNHIVQPGETLFSIAEKYYGEGYEWSRLQESNTWIDPKNLVVGSIVYVPDPKRTYATRSVREPRESSGGGGGGGFLEMLFGSGSRKDEAETTGSLSLNPSSGGGSSSSPFSSLRSMFSELGQVHFLGIPFFRFMFMAASWFLGHLAIQGGLVWFFAHMTFVKDVNFKKAIRSTAQLETLALFCLVVIGVMGLVLIYVGASPPGRPVLGELLGVAEEYIGSSTGLATTGLLVVGLYVILGIRFIPPAFGIANAQGWAVVFLAVLVPHLVFLYLVGHRLGFIG